MRKVLVGAILVAALSAATATPVVAQMISPSFAMSMTEALRGEIQRRSAQRTPGEGADFWHGEVGSLNTGERRTDSLGTLTTDVTAVTIAGFCDSNCSDLDLFVLDENDAIVVQDSGADNHPSVTFIPQNGRSYQARVLMYRCNTSDPCFYSMGAFYTLRDADK